jgi:sporulation protein YqfD
LIEESKIERDLIENFEQISLVSCTIKGQTLIVNIKEKLHPNSIFGDFLPIIADENCKIVDIYLVSGTANVKTGDYVKKGDVLIEPYFVDENGEKRNVEAKASIKAQVYNEGSSCHYDEYIETYRTGKTIVTNELKLFGLSIYSNNNKVDFEKFDVEVGNVDLSKNMIMPFKLYKNVYYELKDRLVKSSFKEVEKQYVEKARKKAFENCNDCDKIIEEYYTTKEMAGVTVVSYCVITEKEIGVYDDC